MLSRRSFLYTLALAGTGVLVGTPTLRERGGAINGPYLVRDENRGIWGIATRSEAGTATFLRAPNGVLGVGYPAPGETSIGRERVLLRGVA